MSIKKIAKMAGVSPSTVSRVLNNPNYKCSTPEMRDNIWRIAIELNYTPNEAARKLRTGDRGESEQVMYIHALMTRTDASQSDPFFTEILQVIESEIHKNLCILANVWYMPVFSNDKRCERENIDQIIEKMYESVDTHSNGLIVIGRCNEDALKKLQKKFKHIVCVNRNSTNYKVDEVLCDGKKIAETAIEHLIELGHKDIAYVGECHHESRYKGYLLAMDKHGLAVNPHFVMETAQTEAEGFKVMEQFIKGKERPSGIYCANDITAIGMLKCLNKNKNRYYKPSVIASDDIREAQYSRPMLTTVGLPKEEMGKFALNLLLDRMRGGHQSVVRMELEGQLVVRESCRPQSDRAWGTL